MAHSDGGVGLEEEQGHRPANDQTAAHHHRPFAGGVTAVVAQQLQAGLGGAGGKALGAARKDPGQGSVGDAVHILGGGEGPADRLLVHVAGEGPEEEAAVDAAVSVDLVNDLQQRLLGGVGGEGEYPGGHPHLFTALEGATLVGQVLRTLAYPDDGQRGDHTPLPQPGCPVSQPLGDGLGRRGSLPDFRHLMRTSP